MEEPPYAEVERMNLESMYLLFFKSISITRFPGFSSSSSFDKGSRKIILTTLSAEIVATRHSPLLKKRNQKIDKLEEKK
jgi:hypothetical protein